jgi:hypothetical protein
MSMNRIAFAALALFSIALWWIIIGASVVRWLLCC